MNNHYTMDLYDLEPVQFKRAVQICLKECEDVIGSVEDKDTIPQEIRIAHKYLGVLLQRLDDVIQSN